METHDITDMAKTLNAIATAQVAYQKAHAGWQRKHDEEFERLVDRVEAIESKNAGPGGTAQSRSAATKEAQEHAERFTAWMRRPHDHGTKAALAEAQ